MAPRARPARSTARKATASSKASKVSKGQTSLAFNNGRVSKPAVTQASAKDKKAEAKTAKLLQEEITADITSNDEEVEDVIVDDDNEQADTASEKAEDVQPPTPLPLRTQSQAKILPPPPAPTGSEAIAKKIPETQIRNYWKAKEAERTTQRVHQDGLSLYEKILREFDMSNQYGPCIGITRMRRWTRAQNLGLQPPMEVLAVLLKGSATAKDGTSGRAYMDILVNTRLGIVAQ